MGSTTREGNDIWADGREFGIVGQTDGTAFVEVLDDGSLQYVGRLPTQTTATIWRDMKVIGDHAYIGSESPGHGLQIFDLKKVYYHLTAWYSGFGSSHNIVAHEETNMIFAVGTARNLSCAGGLWMIDVSDPANPTSPGCVSEDGYVHDDRASPIQISKTPYVGASYTHQGWIAVSDMSYLLLDDELDEQDGTGEAANGHTTTYIFNIKDLANPKHTGTYQSPVRSIDHNQYVIDGLTYQANYGSGLRIVDVSSVKDDPTGKGFKQVGFFDCHPEDDAQGGEVEFVGAWSVYPYFRSGNILLNSIERGVYSLKYTGKA
ncbi:unnamed protein product [Aspergillus oryzae]|nr:unnamed protein product [Aspergillus oryzae]GMF90378.1 unnamed protein product [Aspergillus oryzae]